MQGGFRPDTIRANQAKAGSFRAGFMGKRDHGKPKTGFGAQALGQLVPGLIAPAAKRYGFSSADLL
ncbi:MAG: hypothetical protein KDE55_23490, partial [Novosphingobium sp.]|nr:hypothetical protein [Novosphingobium sp.]